MRRISPLYKLPLGRKGTVTEIAAKGALRRRMQDLGIIDGTSVKVLLKSPSGDPKAYQIRGAVVALRSEDASKIMAEYDIHTVEVM